MSLHKGISMLLLVAVAVAVGCDAQSSGQDASSGETGPQHSSFECPWPFGTFADPENCSKYYVCVGKKAKRLPCPPFMHFDIIRRRCVAQMVAICGKDDEKKEPEPETEGPTDATPAPDDFKCPSMMGRFAHPHDCSRYLLCAMFVAVPKTCPEGELFDAPRQACRPHAEVSCGDRTRPPQYETEPPPTEEEETTTEEEETTTEEEETTTEEITEPEETTTEETTTEELTTFTETTGRTWMTAPPETDCEPDDLDCLIDGEGDPDKWFECKEDIGYYPHPTDIRLFIFCMNWKPSVKKCGQDLIFSHELRTCVSPPRPDDD